MNTFRMLLVLGVSVYLSFAFYGVHGHQCDDDNPCEIDGDVLYMIDDGVFVLSENEAIDLTDRVLLMSLNRENRWNCLAIKVNGFAHCIEEGDHYDLTEKRKEFNLGDLFADKSRCFLDVVDINSPKGAETRVKFRFHCV